MRTIGLVWFLLQKLDGLFGQVQYTTAFEGDWLEQINKEKSNGMHNIDTWAVLTEHPKVRHIQSTNGYLLLIFLTVAFPILVERFVVQRFV